jgi:hypothetical protein
MGIHTQTRYSNSRKIPTAVPAGVSVRNRHSWHHPPFILFAANDELCYGPRNFPVSFRVEKNLIKPNPGVSERLSHPIPRDPTPKCPLDLTPGHIFALPQVIAFTGIPADRSANRVRSRNAHPAGSSS